jgi:protein-tyrosine phosphatase
MSSSVSPVAGGQAADGGDAGGPVRLLTLCTGNAARSVMAGALLRPGRLRIVTAGTHVVEGQPISRRTRDALVSVGCRVDSHRSHQLTDLDVSDADLILAMAGEHVAFIRRRYPEAATKTASIKRLCRDLPPGPEPLLDRIRSLALADLPIEGWEDVEDPAGGDDAVYVSCAEELEALTAALLPRLSDLVPTDR